MTGIKEKYMGKPKIRIIDDSKPQEVEEKKNKKVIASERSNLNSETNQDSDGQASPSLGMTKKIDSSSAPQNDNKEVATKKEDKKTTKKSASKKYRSKKYLEKREPIDKTHSYAINEALEMVKNGSYSKFAGTLEAHINTPNTGIRGLVSLPYASGKKIRILAFGNESQDSGADIVGTEDIIEEINKGKINFDLVVTTPQWMPKLAKVARILGPRGIMPNPKNGTITDDIKKAVEGFQAGKTEYKTESKAPIIHIALGKLDQPTEELAANVKALVITLGKSRIKKLTIAPTIGPSVKVNLQSL